MPIFLCVMSVSFLCWCIFAITVTCNPDSWLFRQFHIQVFNEKTSEREDHIACLILFGATLYPTIGLMIVIQWLVINWNYFMSFVPCVVFV